MVTGYFWKTMEKACAVPEELNVTFWTVDWSSVSYNIAISSYFLIMLFFMCFHYFFVLTNICLVLSRCSASYGYKATCEWKTYQNAIFSIKKNVVCTLFYFFFAKVALYLTSIWLLVCLFCWKLDAFFIF